MTAAGNVLETAAYARLLALGFAPPTADGLLRLADLAGRLGEKEIVAALEEAGLVQLSAEHARLFGPNGVCPPYQGLYEVDPFRETRQLADLAGFYAAFGADAEGPVHERPDHVGCELEFLAFLELNRQAASEDENTDLEETCRETEDVFLHDHLGLWLGRFCSDLAEATDHPVFGALAAVGGRFVEEELDRRGLVVEPVGPRRSQRSPAEQDEVTCGDAAGVVAGKSPLLQIHGKRL